MKYPWLALSCSLVGFHLSACGSDVSCGDGTLKVDGVCVVAPSDGGSDAAFDSGFDPDGGTDDASPDSGCPCTPLLNAVASCASGSCEYTCASGFEDCDGTLENGCEADLESPSTCGSCDVECPVLTGTIGSCELDTCSYECAPSMGDCDSNPINGCEQLLVFEPFCGACNVRCAPGEDCIDGACGPGPDGRWGFVLDTTASLSAASIVGLDDGGAIIVGRWSGGPVTVGPTVLTHVGTEPWVFVARVSPGGLVTWVERISVTNATIVLRDVEVDESSVYLVGELHGRSTADGLALFGASGTIAAPQSTKSGFVAGMALDGSAWTLRQRLPGGDVGVSSIETLSTGELVVAGRYEDSPDFGLGALPDAPAGAGFVAVLDTDGTPLRQVAALTDDVFEVAHFLAVGADDSIYLAAHKLNTVSIGELTAGPPHRTYLARLNPDLTPAWLQGTDAYAFMGITAHPDGLVATYTSAVPSSGGTVSTAAALVALIDETGASRWVVNVAGPAIPVGAPLVDASGRLYVHRNDNRDASFSDLLVLTAEGVPMWSTSFSGGYVTGPARPTASLDASGRMYIGGVFIERVFWASGVLTSPRTTPQFVFASMEAL